MFNLGTRGQSVWPTKLTITLFGLGVKSGAGVLQETRRVIQGSVLQGLFHCQD